MIRNLKFRSKLALLVALPLCALVAVTIPGVTSRLSVVRAENRAQHLQAPSAGLTRLVQALDNENALSNWYLADGGTHVHTQLDGARSQTDHAAVSLRSLVGELRAAHADSAVTGLSRLLTRLRLIGRQRQTVDRRLVGVDSVTGYYQDSVRQVLSVVDAMGSALRDANEVANLRDFATVLRIATAAGQERAILTGGFAQGLLPSALLQDVIGAVAAQDAYRASFEAQASPALRTAFAARIRAAGPVTDRVRSLRGQALAGILGGNAPAAQRWYDASTQQSEILFSAAHGVLAQSDHFGTGRKNTAQREMLVYGAGALGALLVALALAFVIARSTARPLRRLTTAADDVTDRQLPQLLEALRAGGGPGLIDGVTAIPVESRDEIGALARAFNAMENAVVEVAKEQSSLLRQGVSELYVNLARRNQSLLDRQIRMIDELERDEMDPDRLGSLFHVDHLATRMRRNAESLLVLASADHVRQWGNPMSVVDVVRSATAEIADYERVDVLELDEIVQVTGAAVVDVSHLLAELLENATSFSPPESRVVVAGRWYESSYVLSIADQGLGIDDDRLVAANRLLSEPPAPGLALSRSLGLLVVSHLAERTGVAVELRSGDSGTVALVALRPSALVTPEVAPGAEAPEPFAARLAPPLDAGPAPAVAVVPEAPALDPVELTTSALPRRRPGSTTDEPVPASPAPPLVAPAAPELPAFAAFDAFDAAPEPQPPTAASDPTEPGDSTEPAGEGAVFGGPVDDFLPHGASPIDVPARRVRAPRPARPARAQRGLARRRRRGEDHEGWLAPEGWRSDEELSWLVPDDDPSAPPATDPTPEPGLLPQAQARDDGDTRVGPEQGVAGGPMVTAAGLPQRRPHMPADMPADARAPAPVDQSDGAARANRAPEQVLELLAQYEAGRRRGVMDANADANPAEAGVPHGSEDR